MGFDKAVWDLQRLRHRTSRVFCKRKDLPDFRSATAVFACFSLYKGCGRSRNTLTLRAGVVGSTRPLVPEVSAQAEYAKRVW